MFVKRGIKITCVCTVDNLIILILAGNLAHVLLPGSLKVQAQLGATRCPFYVDPCDSETPLDHHTDISQAHDAYASASPHLFPLHAFLPLYLLVYLIILFFLLFLGTFIPWCCADPITTYCLTVGIPTVLCNKPAHFSSIVQRTSHFLTRTPAK